MRKMQRMVTYYDYHRTIWLTYINLSVNVVKNTMFPTSMVDHILRHSNLGSIKNRRLIHVIPNKESFRGALVVVKLELFSPPFARFWIGIIDPRRLSRPAPGFIIIT
jgi:hypothetical protein